MKQNKIFADNTHIKRSLCTTIRREGGKNKIDDTKWNEVRTRQIQEGEDERQTREWMQRLTLVRDNGFQFEWAVPFDFLIGRR